MKTPVKGRHSGSKEAVLAFAKSRGSTNIEELEEFLDVLYDQDIFDAFWIAAQSANETTSWTDDNWKDRLNPAGMGITPNYDYGYGFESGEQAAKAILAHHAAYTGVEVPEEWSALDPRYQAVFDAGFNGKVTNWEDYGSGYWATDETYFESIRDKVNAIRAFEKGEAMPNILNRYLHVSQLGYPSVERRYKGRGGMSPKAIFIHIQEGTNWGSWTWFHQVKASCTVMVAKNGDIWRLVPEEDAPWTNGDVKSPTARGRALINKYGADPNWYTLSIETEGFTREWPKQQSQLDSVVWQVKTWMKSYNLTVNDIYRHADVNQETRPNCPGNEYFNYIVNRIKDEGTDDVPATPVYLKPVPVYVTDTALWKGTKDFTRKDGTKFYAEMQEVEAAKEGAVHVYATKASGTTREPLKVGEKFSVLGWVVGEKVGDENRWWITKYYSRIWAGNTVQKPQRDVPVVNDPTKPNEEEQPDAPPLVTIHNGRAYYPTLEEGKAREVELTKDSPLYKSATTRSRKVGELKKGDTAVVTHFVFGDEVDDEPMWWVLSAGKADPITQGARLPASATFERPE
jgi:hypothetical protein